MTIGDYFRELRIKHRMDALYSELKIEQPTTKDKNTWSKPSQQEGEAVPFGYIREDNFLLGDIIASQTLTRDKVEADDVPLFTRSQPSITRERIIELMREVDNSPQPLSVDAWFGEIADYILAELNQPQEPKL